MKRSPFFPPLTFMIMLFVLMVHGPSRVCAFDVREIKVTNAPAFFQDQEAGAYLRGDFISLIPGDFDGDGRTDFIRQEKDGGSDPDQRTAQVFYGNGTEGRFKIFEIKRNPDYTHQWGYWVEPFSILLKGDRALIVSGDYNGDGRTDFIRHQREDSEAQVFYSDGKDGQFTVDVIKYDTGGRGYSWQYKHYGYMDANMTNLIPGDFNGDGRTDFIRQEKGEWDNDDVATCQVFYSEGEDGRFHIAPVKASQDPYGWGDEAWQYLKGDLSDIITGDFNGDGRTDFIRQEKGHWAFDGVKNAQVFYSDGADGKFSVYALIHEDRSKWLGGDVINIIPGDFNGDGRTDFIRQEKAHWDNDERGTAQVYYSSGQRNGIFIRYDIAAVRDPYGWRDKAWRYLKGDLVNIIPGDFNGDGKTDFIRQEKGKWAEDRKQTAQVFYADTAFGWFTVTDIEAEVDPYGWGRNAYAYLNGDLTTIVTGDFNGDGRIDFIRQEKGDPTHDGVRSAQIFYATDRAAAPGTKESSRSD